jgi:hypothetical protein
MLVRCALGNKTTKNICALGEKKRNISPLSSVIMTNSTDINMAQKAAIWKIIEILHFI